MERSLITVVIQLNCLLVNTEGIQSAVYLSGGIFSHDTNILFLFSQLYAEDPSMILLHVAQRRVQGPKGIDYGPQQSICFALISHGFLMLFLLLGGS
jgi:hypothetical protein